MDVQGEPYLPEQYMRNLGKSDEQDDGIGTRPGKHGVPMLRLFTDQGNPWLCWGAVVGGEQGDGWFELFYHGLLRLDGKAKEGFFTVHIEGEGLDKLCYEMGKHLRPDLRAGSTNPVSVSDKPIVVTSITIREMEMEE